MSSFDKPEYDDDGNLIPRGEDLDGAELLEQVHAFLGRFVAFPSEAAAVAVTLWTAHCHAAESFESTPRLALLSPEPGSGKTRTLEVLELLTPKPMHVLSASPPAIFRSIEVAMLTLLFDECDAIFTKRGKDDSNEDLRALLNAGHRKGATIPRCVGAQHDVHNFPVYSPVALAGLGDLPATLMSRAVVIRMKRRAPSEYVEPFRYRLAEPEGHQIRDRLAAWCGHIAGLLADAWPDMPKGVTDRPADVWEPLLAVADAAGGDWPKRARAACIELTAVAETGAASLGIRLLGDLAQVFGDDDQLSTTIILDRLIDLDEAPWGDLYGKALDARGLARRLGAYQVKSTNIRDGASVMKGYRTSDLHDSWARYAPGSRTAATAATAATGQVADLFEVADSEAVADPAATAPEPATDPGPLTSSVTPVADVADTAQDGESYPAGEAGACTKCGTLHHRYGDGGHPLCDACRHPGGVPAYPASLKRAIDEHKRELFGSRGDDTHGGADL